jgi:uncharacterized protein
VSSLESVQGKREVWAVVGKLPTMGFSKTRLAKTVGEESALKLYDSFIEDFFSRYEKYCQNTPMIFFGTPNVEKTEKYFQHMIQSHNISGSYLPQDDVSFFDRLKNIFQHISEVYGPETIINLTGTDIPDFPFEQISLSSKNLLNTQDIAIGPDSDGGFYYLRSQAAHFNIFDIGTNFESSEVFERITQKILQLHLSCHKVLNWSDIDVFEDLQKCTQRSSSFEIPNTYRVFEELALKSKQAEK